MSLQEEIRELENEVTEMLRAEKIRKRCDKIVNFLFSLWCVSLGFILYPIVTGFISNTPTAQYNKAIEQCEAELPRNIECKVVGVPENE